MANELLKAIILGEISGKNQAIHAYDKMIWTVRTGFLTLIFAGWGLLLSSLSNNIGGTAADPIAKAWPLLAAMASVSFGLGVAGFIVDLNYVRRKFRVIAALNELMAMSIKHEEVELTNHKFVTRHIRPHLYYCG